ncbi:MAG: AbiTii domain-containing protein, partial [Alphaproteobacteria bacterium]
MEEWIKHESEGYPSTTNVPEYRKIDISYSATFSGAFGSGIQNAPIPPFLIEKFAGEQWLFCQLRQSISAIDE